MNARSAIAGARIFDGEHWHDHSALLLADKGVAGIVPEAGVASGIDLTHLDGGILVPGFVDLQVNGGGGVMLNDRQDVDALRTITAAHARFGTTALLATLITDTPAVTSAAVEAVARGLDERVPGLLGLHLEGPHLSVSRKGAHDPALIRPMTDDDLAFLIRSRDKVPVLYSTVAVESATPSQVAALAKAGIVVSLGHSDATAAQAAGFAAAGATVVTHLFNAMSQIGNREPGLAGAALNLGGLSCGLIADGIHVHAETMALAVRAKAQPGHVFLVTDAMATIGTDMTSFELNGRTIHRRDGSLRLEDGTLAGADLDMISAVRFMHRTVGIPLAEALRMASLYPARAVGCADRLGWLGAGSAASMVHLGDHLNIRGVWIEGDKQI